MSNNNFNNELAQLINQQNYSIVKSLASRLNIEKIGAQLAKNTIVDFLLSYKQKDDLISNQTWLISEFKKYPNIWSNDDELFNSAQEIVTQVESYQNAQTELQEYYAKGLSRSYWLSKKIEQGAKANGVADVGAYATQIDDALNIANEANINVLYRNDGQINQQLNLDGFIAEHHHANTFNIDAVAKGSEYRAEVLQPKSGQPYSKNSVDIVIKDGNGRIVRKYQSKYGADAKSTGRLLKKGNYRGQRKLVPKGQAQDVKGSSDTISIEGIESKTLSKAEAKQLQKNGQEKNIAKQHDWNEADKIVISKNIGRQVALASMLSIGFQGARVLGRRIWNTISGNDNQSVDEDLQEFVKSSLLSAKSTGIAVAVTGGVTVAVKSGWLGNALKNTSAGRIANAVCIGIENAKVLHKYSKGELTGEEALDKAGSASFSLVGSLALGVKGSTAGAAIGSALGPIGTVLGGLTGGILGGIAGSTAGEAIYQGGKNIVSKVASTIKSMSTSIVSSVSSVAGSILSCFG